MSIDRTVTLYVRLAHDPSARANWRVATTLTERHDALTDTDDRPLRTLRFRLRLKIPGALLSPAEWPMIEAELDPALAEQLPIEVQPVAVDG